MSPYAKGWRGACRTACVPAPIREEGRGGHPPVREKDARGGGLCPAPALPCPVEAQKTPLLCINRGRIGGRRRVPRLLSCSIERGPGEKEDCVPFAPPPPTYLRLSWSHSPVRRQTDGGAVEPGQFRSSTPRDYGVHSSQVHRLIGMEVGHGE